MDPVITSLIQDCIQTISLNDSKYEQLSEEYNFSLGFCREMFIQGNPKHLQERLILLEATIDKLWEKLNKGCWKDIPDYIRDAYAYTSLLKACIQLRCANSYRDIAPKETIFSIIETADKGLLLGNSFRKELNHIAASLCLFIHLNYDSEIIDINSSYPFHQTQPETKSYCNKFNTVTSVLTTDRPSLDTFHLHYFKRRLPLKLLGCIEHWPALKKWSNLKYILDKMGPRLVPVEIGSSYTSADWSQKLVTIEDFMKQFIIPCDPKQRAYLAQHQLFNQIPELLDDIREPDYCIFSDISNSETTNDVDVNAWFGPSQTISDLHYDPKHNFLAQVVGKKRVLLIDPKWSSNVYPRQDHLLHNTAEIDPENPDFDQYPAFKSVEILECILNEGEMLYIPPKWWHHVRSLSVSFSVSFWWGC